MQERGRILRVDRFGALRLLERIELNGKTGPDVHFLASSSKNGAALSLVLTHKYAFL